MSYYKRLRNDLAAAAAEGLISPEQADRVWQRAYGGRLFANFRAAHWIGAAAGFFVALGLILVVASNWDKIGDISKMGAFLLLFAGAAEAAVRLDDKPGAAIPLETLWFFMPVLGIGLYAQIFNLSGDPVKPYLAWAVLSAPLALLSRRPLAGYLCSILLFAVLFWGTLGRGNMLALNSLNAGGYLPFLRWGLALLVLGAAVLLYPGRRLGLPLGAAVVWLFLMLVSDTAIKLRSESLLLLAGMSLSALWLTWSDTPDDDKAALPLKTWIGAVYLTTFFWHHKPGSYSGYGASDTVYGAALAWLLLAGALLSALFRPQRLLPRGEAEDVAAKALLAASVLCAFLLFGAGELSSKILAVTANLLLAAFGAANILSGAKNASERHINLGVAVIALTALTRFIDIFGGLLVSGLGFIFTGLAFAALAYFVNKGRKALIESVKK